MPRRPSAPTSTHPKCSTDPEPATVSNGHLHGQYEKQYQANSLTLDGTIHPDARASMVANGVTGPFNFNVNQVQQGQPYDYTVTAQFEGSHGRGARRQLRPCEIDFVRQ